MGCATPARRTRRPPAAVAPRALALVVALVFALTGATDAGPVCPCAPSTADLPDLSRWGELGAAACGHKTSIAERCRAARALARAARLCDCWKPDDVRSARALLDGDECATSLNRKDLNGLASLAADDDATNALAESGTAAAGDREEAAAVHGRPGAVAGAALGRRGRPDASADRSRTVRDPLSLGLSSVASRRGGDATAWAPREPPRDLAEAGSGSLLPPSARPLASTSESVGAARHLASDPRALSLFVGVVSASWNGERREAIRATWGQEGAGFHRVLFFLGEAERGDSPERERGADAGAGDWAGRLSRVPRALAEEHRSRGGDLRIVPGVRESYWNITHQTLAVMCAGANMADVTHVVKADDDSFLRPFGLRKALSSLPDRLLFWGALEKAGGQPNRNPADQWHVGEDEWPAGETYPAWAHGAGYAVTVDVARAIARRFGCLEEQGSAKGEGTGRGGSLGTSAERESEEPKRAGMAREDHGLLKTGVAQLTAAPLPRLLTPLPSFFLDVAPPLYPSSLRASMSSSTPLERTLPLAVGARFEAEDEDTLGAAEGSTLGGSTASLSARTLSSSATRSSMFAIYPSPPPRLFRLEDVAMGSWVERAAASLSPHQPVTLVTTRAVNYWGCAKRDVISHYITAEAAKCLWAHYAHGAESSAGGSEGGDAASDDERRASRPSGGSFGSRTALRDSHATSLTSPRNFAGRALLRASAFGASQGGTRYRSAVRGHGECAACHRYQPGKKEAAEGESARAKAAWLQTLEAGTE